MAEATEPIVAPDAAPDVIAERFSEFYHAVHGRDPFAWQKRLAAEVLDPAKDEPTGWPDVIRVPTGCGKTSILDIAIFELAVLASRDPAAVAAARRVCFVVDRKLIVDEATDHAATIRRKLIDEIDPRSILGRIAAALRSLTPHADEENPDQAKREPLRVVRLRGGVYRDDGWAADPLTPTIILSTVDQIGSRLLFRGYGVSQRARAVHAGLLAFDTHIILDEAHLSTVFATTIMGRTPGGDGPAQQVAGIRPYQQWAEQVVLREARQLRFTRMSATAGVAATGELAFQLSHHERSEPSIKPRLEAKKPAELIEVPVDAVTKAVRDNQPRVAREIDRKNREKLVEAMVSHARLLAVARADGQTGRPRIVGLVFNRVASARQAFNALRLSSHNANAPGSSTAPQHNAILLTGRIRPFDRDRLLSDWLPRIKAGRNGQPVHPLFVVATQTVEVGANIDLDALVTEAAPLDALRQRFGRLYRIPDQPPNRPPAEAAVFIQSDHAKDSSTDPLYGSALAETWAWLTRSSDNRSNGKPRGKKAKKGSSDASPSIDFGSSAMDPKVAKLTEDELDKLLAPRPEAPILFPAHLDAWAQTSPQPDPDPDVAPFLHGPGSGSADVQVVWRADLTPKNRERWAQIVSLMPPRTREALAVPLHEARAWLCSTPAVDATDVEGATTLDPDATGRRQPALRWRGSRKSRVVRPEHLRAGDTIVVPASYGGADKFGWLGARHPDSRGTPPKPTPVPDIADECLAELVASYPRDAFRRPPLRVRLHPALLLEQTKPEDRSKIRSMLSQAAWSATNDGDPLDVVRRAFSHWPSLTAMGETIRAACEAVASSNHPTIEVYPDGQGVVISARITFQNPAASIPEHDLEFDEPDDDRTSMLDGGNPVTLDDHTRAVVQTAATFARACALPDNLRAALETAAYWHDQGKRDRRFQAWLHGSELAAFAALAENPARILAKSARPSNGKVPSSALFGYPKGHRHEFVSIRLFEQAAEHANSAGSPIANTDLVKFLIGTHHGRGRAFAPVSRDHHPVHVRMHHDGKSIAVFSDHALHTLDSGWTDLFWSLIRRHGWWGLAYLQAILITADHHVSSSEQRQAADTSAESSPSRSKSPAPIQPSLQPSRATSVGSSSR